MGVVLPVVQVCDSNFLFLELELVTSKYDKFKIIINKYGIGEILIFIRKGTNLVR